MKFFLFFISYIMSLSYPCHGDGVKSKIQKRWKIFRTSKTYIWRVKYIHWSTEHVMSIHSFIYLSIYPSISGKYDFELWGLFFLSICQILSIDPSIHLSLGNIVLRCEWVSAPLKIPKLYLSIYLSIHLFLYLRKPSRMRLVRKGIMKAISFTIWLFSSS